MKLRNAIVVVAMALVSATAFAVPTAVQLSNIQGTWQTPQPPDTGDGSPHIVNGSSPGTLSTIRWGNAATSDGQSGYDFTAVPVGVNPGDQPLTFSLDPPSVTVSGTQLLGTFNHLNFPIFPPNLESVTLNVAADVSIDGFPQSGSPFHFLFDFTHDETPNGAGPNGPFIGAGTCPYPVAGSPNGIGVNVNGCADKVTVSANALSQNFTIGGVSYTLDILGFSQDGGTTITDNFVTTEAQNNTAGLYARVTAVNAPTVPEPGSLALLGLGLLAAGFMRRKSNR